MCYNTLDVDLQLTFWVYSLLEEGAFLKIGRKYGKNNLKGHEAGQGDAQKYLVLL